MLMLLRLNRVLQTRPGFFVPGQMATPAQNFLDGYTGDEAAKFLASGDGRFLRSGKYRLEALRWPSDENCCTGCCTETAFFKRRSNTHFASA